MASLEQVRSLLGEVLQLGERKNHLEPSTPLLGSLPELDSMAVATVIAGMEERFGIMIDDDEIDAEVFRTVGTLTKFVDRKLEA